MKQLQVETRVAPLPLEQWPVLGEVSTPLLQIRNKLVGNWTQGTWHDLNGRTCAIGAIMWRDAYVFDDDWSSLAMWLGKARGESTWDNVPEFNDLPTTTEADVLALYDAAIALAISEGK